MMLPPHSVAAGPATTTTTTYNSPATTSPSSGLPGLGPGNWSSLIGIITAIVGNVLISFALNLQRYAHIRLERERQDKERSRKRRSTSYDGSQPNVAEERAKGNLGRKYHRPRHADVTVDDERDGLNEGVVATESDPLIPYTESRRNTRPHSRPALHSTDTATAAESYKQQSYLKSPYWWTGIVLMTTGEVGNFLAYGFAPASIVSPLGVVALIINCIIAPIMLREHFRGRDGLGVLVAVAGAVTVVLSANDNNPKLGPDEIWNLITTWEFETYLGITIAVIAALMVASNRYGDKNILIDLGLVGLYGGYTALSTKGVASMLSYTLFRALTFPVTYLLVAILVFTAVMQIKYVNRALQRFDATQVIPTQFVLFTLSVILGSAILYRDFERTSGDDAGKFIGGCALTFLGVWLITSGRPRRNDDEDRAPEPEDAINLVDEERFHDDVDAAGNGEAGSSRRSSTLRATSPPMAINTRIPTRDASQPGTPDIRVTSAHPLDTATRSPLNATPDAPSPLTDNPWEDDSPTVARTRPPPAPLSRNSTLSAPILPSGPTIAPRGTTSSPELPIDALNPPRPQTPLRGISDSLAPVTPSTTSTLTPAGTARLRRIATAERLGARYSLGAGPLLASPLSTSLSAMVADLKRSGSVRSTHTQRDGVTVRRRESVLGIGAQEIDPQGEGVGEPLDRRRTATEGGEGERARSRGLSGTFGDIWRGLRKGAEEGGGGGDVESRQGERDEGGG
ncbi:DUF803-domain-containing protein [Polyplosphaeria fusca]|uniref:DUF803-domain-containing protein n=1 Tax=Polyplosphaeria fusca TaxID=682080 RepID=A0A9P4R3U0_9PLEO|nr:DUF803-domain-containing protein [Polyplosphaeria fusca]